MCTKSNKPQPIWTPERIGDLTVGNSFRCPYQPTDRGIYPRKFSVDRLAEATVVKNKRTKADMDTRMSWCLYSCHVILVSISNPQQWSLKLQGLTSEVLERRHPTFSKASEVLISASESMLIWTAEWVGDLIVGSSYWCPYWPTVG